MRVWRGEGDIRGYRERVEGYEGVWDVKEMRVLG